ncbi:MAG: ABC transporter permease [Bacteroidia bacterium]
MNVVLATLTQITESIKSALSSLQNNKLRSFLSTLGITIGIFSIIMVLSIVNSLQKNLENSVNSLGKDVAFVDKWPWEFGSDYKWWKYMNRPNPTISELKKIEERSVLAKASALTVDINRKTLKFLNRIAENASGVGVTYQYNQIRELNFGFGRYFTEDEAAKGDFVVILGYNIAENLFQALNPIDRFVMISGNKFKVIGVLAKEGESLINNSLDNSFLIPAKTAGMFLRLNNQFVNARIQVKAKDNVSINMLSNELTGIMRSIRKLGPAEEADFSINKTTLLIKPLKSLFSVVNMAGWVIGGFAMLVGGFGIANIMFVSVKERTQQIGIQKSLGAKNYFILIEFLTEAVLLCLVGGIIGICMVYGITVAVKNALEVNLFLSNHNIIIGILVSVIIGIISGFIPAYTAANLNPVDAIRSK